MSASVTCDGCSVVVEPQDSELWLKLYVPKDEEPIPSALGEMQEIMSMLTGQRSKPKFQLLEFCSFQCVLTKAMAIVYSTLEVE